MDGPDSEALAAALQPALGPGLEVTEPERLSGGASRQTWAFSVRDQSGDDHPLILQRQRPGGIRTGGGMSAEAQLMEAAGRRGVPVPRVLGSGDDDGLGGPWVITRRLDGETIPRRLFREQYDTARAGLAEACGRALAGIHAIGVDEVAGLHGEDQVEQFATLLADLGRPHPALEAGLAWLDAHRPEPTGHGVVHGDFRMGNLLVDTDGLVGVIDWELAHLGDPLEDLGWLCARAWRFGNEAPVGGFGRREDLYAAYEAAGGGAVDPTVAHWWEVLATLKWGVMCIIQAETHLAGLTRSTELAAIGRRTCENEYDLLLLIDPGGAPEPTPVAEAPANGAHDAPTAAELLEAVGSWLRDDVVDRTEGSLQYQARVAANVIAVVEREILAGPALARAEAERLAVVGIDDQSELAAALRDGRRSFAEPAVRAAVWGDVVDKLSVANPRYFSA